VFVPTASHLVRTLESPDLQKKPTSTQKPPDFKTTLKISKVQLHSKGTQDLMIENVFELLLDHFSVHSCSIGFPELIFPTCHQIKRVIKSSKVVKLNKDMRQLVDRLNEQAKYITARRSNVTFAPKDTQQVQEWEEDLKTESNPLVKYLESWKTLQERKDEEGDDHGEEKKPKKKRKLAKTTDKKAVDVKKKKIQKFKLNHLKLK